MHGIKRRASLINSDRIDHLYQDPHDPDRRLFLHYGDMTDSLSLLRIIQQVKPDIYQPLETLPTAVSGRTMAIDPTSGRLFIIAADTDPSPTPGGRARPRPGTTRVMLFDPVH